jgi:hypothetical protein
MRLSFIFLAGIFTLDQIAILIFSIFTTFKKRKKAVQLK